MQCFDHAHRCYNSVTLYCTGALHGAGSSAASARHVQAAHADTSKHHVLSTRPALCAPGWQVSPESCLNPYLTCVVQGLPAAPDKDPGPW